MLPFPTPNSARDIRLTVSTGCVHCKASGLQPGTANHCPVCNGTRRGIKAEITLFDLYDLLTLTAGELAEQKKVSQR